MVRRLLPAVLLLLVIGAVSNESFLERDNLLNVLSASSALGLLVLTEAMILISGKMDLSLESIAGLDGDWKARRSVCPP